MEMENGRALRWLRLDNAAKIYPASRRRNWSNIYRLSVTLTERVDVALLQGALEVTVKRFPSIAARLRKGAFWYYLQQVEKAPEIQQEHSYPLTFMSPKEMRQCALRVIAYENRIAIELFHSLTDGTGALCFLKSLTAEYLQRRYGVTVPAEHGVLDRREAIRPGELEDSFPKYAGSVPASRRSDNAWRLSGNLEPDGFLNLTCFRLPVDRVKEKAKEYGVTVTVLLSAVMMRALLLLQEEKVPEVERRDKIRLLIPINLRNLFPSRTLRNFSMYTIPELDSRLGAYTLEEICQIIRHKMGTDFTRKHMSAIIATNVKSEKSTLVRLIPLPIKNMVMKAVFENVGQKKCCLSFSNLGVIRLPEVMKPYVRRMDFILGAQAASAYNCGMVSYGDTVYINFIRNIREAELERHFYGELQRLGIPVTVESNRGGGSCTV